MPKDASVTLSEKALAFVEKKVRDGEFKSPDETVNAALQMMEDNDRKREALWSALKEGEESGFIDFDFDDFIARKRSHAKAS